MIRDVKNRTKLETAIPIATPFVCHIEVTNVCNFKCEFCASVDNPKVDAMKKGFMDYQMFCKIIDDIREFKGQMKQLIFHLLGEPLLHPQIANMIAYAKKAEVSEKLILYTNGSKLTPELSRQICDAGIDYIQLSIEHVNNSGYEKVTRVKLDYDKFLANVGYLCAYKPKESFVSAKILDCGLTDEEKEKFYKDFTGITDECHIETLMQTVPLNIKDTTMGHGRTTTNDGYEAVEKEVCTPPFYLLGISWDGLVSPCVCDWQKGIIVGDVSRNSVKEIWEGDKMKEFRKMQLSKKRRLHPICGSCQALFNQLDNIDEFAEELYERIK